MCLVKSTKADGGDDAAHAVKRDEEGCRATVSDAGKECREDHAGNHDEDDDDDDVDDRFRVHKHHKHVHGSMKYEEDSIGDDDDVDGDASPTVGKNGNVIVMGH